MADFGGFSISQEILLQRILLVEHIKNFANLEKLFSSNLRNAVRENINAEGPNTVSVQNDQEQSLKLSFSQVIVQYMFVASS